MTTWAPAACGRHGMKECHTYDIATQNGPFDILKRAVLHPDSGRFANMLSTKLLAKPPGRRQAIHPVKARKAQSIALPGPLQAQQNLMSAMTWLPTWALSRATKSRLLMLRSARRAGLDSLTKSVWFIM